MRVAERLGRELATTNGGLVAVAQRGRNDISTYNAVYATLLPEWLNVAWDAVVVFRKPAALTLMKQCFPAARLVLWLEDLADARLFHPAIAATHPLVVTASEFHKRNVTEWLRQRPLEPFPQVVHIFNPIDDDLRPEATAIDPNKLVFFSSPNKGLNRTIDVFRQARRVNPAFELYIANPGYRPWQRPSPLPEGVCDLGGLSQSEVLQHVRGSLCVFHLNDVYPETFGCVFAEANAVGTPVLTHPMGAASEVLTVPGQLIDVRETTLVIERLMAWRSGARPDVMPDQRFRTTRVVEEWKRVIGIAG